MAEISPSLVADLTARLERLEARTEVLEAENRALRAAAPPGDAAARRSPVGSGAEVPSTAAPAADAVVAAPAEAGAGGGVGRRKVLTKGLAAAGAAAAGAVLLEGSPAAAANGQPILIGGNNTGSGTTVLSGSTFYAGVTNNEALYAVSNNGGGAYVFGGQHHLWFGASNTRNPPTSDGTEHAQGEVVLDRFGFLWLCTQGGRPGTWRSMSGNGSAGAFYPFSPPQRTYDSRPGTSPTQGPKTKLAANATRTISLANVGAVGLIPTTGVLLNILLVNAAPAPGNFTVWQGGAPIPLSNTMVWGGSNGRYSTLAFSVVDEAGRINLRASQTTDIVIDVVGLYR